MVVDNINWKGFVQLQSLRKKTKAALGPSINNVAKEENRRDTNIGVTGFSFLGVQTSRLVF